MLVWSFPGTWEARWYFSLLMWSCFNVATKKPLYLFAGLGSGCLAAVIAYFLFSHGKTESCCLERSFLCMGNFRLPDPPGLFAIGAGGWFGVGLCKDPRTDPHCAAGLYVRGGSVRNWRTFCYLYDPGVGMSMFLLVVNISLRIKKRFYKLIALGWEQICLSGIPDYRRRE